MERKRERKRVRDRALFHAIVTEGGRGQKREKAKAVNNVDAEEEQMNKKEMRTRWRVFKSTYWQRSGL